MPCGRQASYGTNRRKRLPALSAPMFARIGESGGRNETKVNCHPEAGFIASKIVNRSGEGMILDIVLGIVGGVVGGWLFSFFGAEGVTGFNLYSMVVAIVGAIVVLFVYHAITGRRTMG
jgi:uncharacterized membrane protein YeaQ/YmgE (transglycosylase-associated protein family)